ncbi:MAG: hypothetical protein M0R70_06460 [Nitrospirae bacterium]|nr:hypothetical protein [Nitrospirota bacterium]
MTQLEIKRTIQQALEQNDLDAVVSLVQQHRRALSQLVRIAYDKDTLAGWRAIKAIGRVAKALVKTDDEFLRVTIRKLLWSLSDESGGIGWAAPEILGEIVSADPGKFSDIIPLIAEVYEIEEKVFRPGVIYALMRIAETSPELVMNYQKIIISSLTDGDPMIRIYILDLIRLLWPIACKKNIWSKEYQDKIENAIINLKNDGKVVWIYKNSAFIDIEVGDAVKNVMNELKIYEMNR